VCLLSFFRKCAVFLFLAALAACGSAGSRKYLQKGELYTRQGKYADASIQFRKAIQDDPHLGTAYYGLGMAELKQKHFGDAHLALQQAVTLMPDDENAARELAQLCLTSYLGDYHRPKDLYDEIASLADRMISRDENSFDGLRLKGYLAAADSKIPEAIEYFRKADAVNPFQPDVVTALVQNLLAAKRSAEAEAVAQSFLGRQKDSIPVYDVLYFHYVADGQLEKAEAVLRQKIANNPGEPAFVMELCRNQRQQGKTAAVAACLQQLTAGFPQGTLLEADFYGEMDNWPEAIRRYEALAREHPADADLCRKRIIGALIKQGKRDEAARNLETFLRDHPRDVEARGSRALLLVESRKPENIERGVAEFKSLSAADPASADLHEKLGMALAARIDLSAAEAEFQEALKLNPLSLPALLGLAEISVKTERFDDGLRYTATILSHAPKNAIARLYRTTCLIGTGQLPAARHELLGAIAEDPQNREAQLQLALVDFMEKHYMEAEQRFRAHYRPGESDFRALKGIVQIYQVRNQFPEALALLKQELKKSPDSTEVQGLLADTAMRARQYDVAVAAYKSLAEASPRNAVVLMNLGNAYMARQDYAAAVTALRQADQLQPDNREIAPVLGSALEAAGRLDEAKAFYRQYLKAHAEDFVVLNNLAYLMAETGENLDQAQQFSEEALRGAPSHPDFLDTLALVHLKKNNAAAALQILTNLTEKYEKNPAFRYHFGLALLKTGSADRAYAELRTALALGLPPREAGEARNLLRN
jgi:tetratricopeptide (TPR) repeat protein